MSRTPLTRALIGTAALLATLAACTTDDPGDAPSPSVDDQKSSAPTPGVTDTEVVVGTHHPLTGPAAEGYSSIHAATRAYFEHINDSGGIHGRSIRYVVKDDGYNPATTQTVGRELVLDEQVFAILNGLGTPPHSAILDFLDENEVPDLFVASGSPLFNRPEEYPRTFGFNVDYVVEAKILATHALAEHAGGTYCLLAQDDDLGEDFEKGLRQVLGEDALAVVQHYTTSNPDVAAQVAAMQQGGCDVNFLAAINGFSALSIGTAAQLGYHPQWLAASIGGDYNTISGALGEHGPALLEGFVSTNYLPSHFGDSDWTEHFRAVQRKYLPDATFDGNTVYGMSVAYLFAEALALAGENPTREGVLEAVTSGGLRGNGVVPVALGPTEHVAYSGAQITLVSGGEQHYVGTPFLTGRGDEPVEPYDGAPVPLENDGVPAT